MLTTRRFNRRRAAEIRTRHRERRESREHSEFVFKKLAAMGLLFKKPDDSFDQAYARFQAERLRVMAESDRQAEIEMRRWDAGQACGAAVAAHAKKPRSILARVLGWLPWR